MPNDQDQSQDSQQLESTVADTGTPDTGHTEPEVIENDDGTLDDNVVADHLSGEGVAKPKPLVPAYVPNTKFKVQDQEKEFDDWIKPALTKDNEAKVRELYEKAHGLDVVKPKLERERQARQDVTQQLSSVMGEVQEIISLRDEGDLDAFFDKVKLPAAKVAQWLLDKINRQNLPPEQQAVYNQADELRRERRELSKQLQTQSSAGVDAGVQARTLELNGVLSRPDIQPLVEQFNGRAGQPDAFFKLVARHAATEYQMSGGKRDLTPEEAVNDVVKLLGLQPQAPSQGSQPSVAAAQPKVHQPAKKPTVIPNVGNTAVSPTGSRPKSIADLKKLRDSFGKED